jgi:CRISPR-associated endonuclease/helicase Cas3
MHIVLVSACEKRALKRTRAVLDSYALRSGDSTWMTPITEEGLGELRAMLRRQATRQTAVACFRNDGRARMRLLWVVGRRDRFDRHGASPVASQQRKTSSTFPPWARTCAVLAEAAGWSHDLGKFGKVFQQKLREKQPKADPVRHEWISLLLVRQFLEQERLDATIWKQAWERLPELLRSSAEEPFGHALRNSRDALLFMIATHHRLPHEQDRSNVIDDTKHVSDSEGRAHRPVSVAAPSPQTLNWIARKLGRAGRPASPEQGDASMSDPVYWRAVSLSRRSRNQTG